MIKMKLNYLMALESIHSIHLYELLKSLENNSKVWSVEIDKFKDLMECQNYIDLGLLRKEVLEVAVKDINEHTDLNIEYEFHETIIEFKYQ